MTSSREMSNDLTTDATPSPSRSTVKENVEEVNENIDKETEFVEEIRTNMRKIPHKGFTKIKKSRIPTAQATIININNSNGIHVGDEIVYNFNNRSDKTKGKADIEETAAMKSLKANDSPLQSDDLLFVATHMDETWQDTARALKFSDGEIQQFIINNRHLGIKEVIYQLLLDWTQNEPTEAKIGKLCNVLWKNNQQDVVKRWSERQKEK